MKNVLEINDYNQVYASLVDKADSSELYGLAKDALIYVKYLYGDVFKNSPEQRALWIPKIQKSVDDLADYLEDGGWFDQDDPDLIEDREVFGEVLVFLRQVIDDTLP